MVTAPGVLVVALCSGIPAAHAVERLQVETGVGWVSVAAEDAPVWRVIQEVARSSGFSVEPHSPLKGRVTLDVQRRSLADTLRTILRDRDFTVEYDQVADQESRPMRLWILGGGPETELTGDHGEAAQYIAALNDEDPSIRLDAVVALAQVGGNDETVEALISVLDDSDPEVREAATTALGDIGGQLASEGVERSLTDPDVVVREAAIAASMEVGGADTVRLLTLALYDPDPDMRQDAMDNLTEIGGDEAARAVAVLLYDNVEWLQESAAEALGEIGGETALSLLHGALTSPNKSVRETAESILAENSTRAHWE